MAPFYGLGSTASRLQSYYEEVVYWNKVQRGDKKLAILSENTFLMAPSSENIITTYKGKPEKGVRNCKINTPVKTGLSHDTGI